MPTEPAITHAELCQTAGDWLRTQMHCPVVLIEPRKRLGESLRGEIPDVLGWVRASESHVIECKVSRADLKADLKKPARSSTKLAAGSFRWLCAPKGMVHRDDLYDHWGLIELHKDGLAIHTEATRFNVRATQFELGLTLTAIKWMQQATGVTARHAQQRRSKDLSLELQERIRISVHCHWEMWGDGMTIADLLGCQPEIQRAVGTKTRAIEMIHRCVNSHKIMGVRSFVESGRTMLVPESSNA